MEIVGEAGNSLGLELALHVKAPEYIPQEANPFLAFPGSRPGCWECESGGRASPLDVSVTKVGNCLLAQVEEAK